ncbi:hypothetical protein [Proteus mirabilis]|uniref:hypothetical protein n=1 Tax=Proteus mirabilis TaxID=584 RepID=UPI0034D728B1
MSDKSILNAPHYLLRAALASQDVSEFIARYIEAYEQSKEIFAIHKDKIMQADNPKTAEANILALMNDVTALFLGSKGNATPWVIVQHTPSSVGRAFQAELLKMFSSSEVTHDEVINAINRILFEVLNLDGLIQHLKDKSVDCLEVVANLNHQAISLLTYRHIGYGDDNTETIVYPEDSELVTKASELSHSFSMALGEHMYDAGSEDFIALTAMKSAMDKLKP